MVCGKCHGELRVTSEYTVTNYGHAKPRGCPEPESDVPVGLFLLRSLVALLSDVDTGVDPEGVRRDARKLRSVLIDRVIVSDSVEEASQVPVVAGSPAPTPQEAATAGAPAAGRGGSASAPPDREDPRDSTDDARARGDDAGGEQHPRGSLLEAVDVLATLALMATGGLGDAAEQEDQRREVAGAATLLRLALSARELRRLRRNALRAALEETSADFAREIAEHYMSAARSPAGVEQEARALAAEPSRLEMHFRDAPLVPELLREFAQMVAEEMLMFGRAP